MPLKQIVIIPSHVDEEASYKSGPGISLLARASITGLLDSVAFTVTGCGEKGGPKWKSRE